MTHTLPIAVIDSGVGGLSIAKAINQKLPNESMIYVADSAYAPYGDKSAAQICERTAQITKWLLTQNIKALVLACNTATLYAVEQLRAEFSLPIIGVEPAIKPAAQLSQNKKVGLLVTQATSQSQRFLTLVQQYKNDSEVYIQPCPGLVQLIEQGEFQSEKCKQLLGQYLQPLLDNNIDTLVLGCTHYPFLQPLINDICGASIRLIDTAEPVAKQLQRRLTGLNLLTKDPQKGKISFFTSQNNGQQQAVFQQLWQQNITLNSIYNFI